MLEEALRLASAAVGDLHLAGVGLVLSVGGGGDGVGGEHGLGGYLIVSDEALDLVLEDILER